MSDSNPRFIIRSFVIIGLLFTACILHQTEIKVVAICNLDTISRCNDYEFVPGLQCDSVANPDSACQSYVGDYIVKTNDDCCLALSTIPEPIPETETSIKTLTMLLTNLINRFPDGTEGEFCCYGPDSITESPSQEASTHDLDQTNNDDDDDASNISDDQSSQVNTEAVISEEDNSECSPILLHPFTEYLDKVCEIRCEKHAFGDQPRRHYCKNRYKCCCNSNSRRGWWG